MAGFGNNSPLYMTDDSLRYFPSEGMVANPLTKSYLDFAYTQVCLVS